MSSIKYNNSIFKDYKGMQECNLLEQNIEILQTESENNLASNNTTQKHNDTPHNNTDYPKNCQFYLERLSSKSTEIWERNCDFDKDDPYSESFLATKNPLIGDEQFSLKNLPVKPPRVTKQFKNTTKMEN